MIIFFPEREEKGLTLRSQHAKVRSLVLVAQPSLMCMGEHWVLSAPAAVTFMASLHCLS